MTIVSLREAQANLPDLVQAECAVRKSLAGEDLGEG